jgi:fructose-bisphosphate aldolase class I
VAKKCEALPGGHIDFIYLLSSYCSTPTKVVREIEKAIPRPPDYSLVLIAIFVDIRSMSYLSPSHRSTLETNAALLATPGKGITACDESPGTLGSRFEAVNVQNTVENRRRYRQMLLASPGISKYLSGAILDPETLLQKSDQGVLFPELLAASNILVGVKPHLKVYVLPGAGGDTVMQGLDSLAERARAYYSAGARFAKWRSPLTIDVAAGRPTPLGIASNMTDLARYALICQSEGLVPIVEPDISLVGAHTLEDSIRVAVTVHSALYKAMVDHGVFMEGATLKPSVVNPGKSCPVAYSVEEIATANLFVLRQCFPTAMPGLNYLSGGQSLADAAARLSCINKLKNSDPRQRHPWNISFSWSQALQLPLLELCREKGELALEPMEKLYREELEMAARAAEGKHQWGDGEGAHRGDQV